MCETDRPKAGTQFGGIRWRGRDPITVPLCKPKSNSEAIAKQQDRLPTLSNRVVQKKAPNHDFSPTQLSSAERETGLYYITHRIFFFCSLVRSSRHRRLLFGAPPPSARARYIRQFWSFSHNFSSAGGVRNESYWIGPEKSLLPDCRGSWKHCEQIEV